MFVVGSFLQESKDIKKSMASLKSSIKGGGKWQ
jgi:hypothetical protein